MVVSLLLLSSFVSYWLVSQYQNERKTLRYQLTNTYHQVRNDMLERLIYESIITPIIENSNSNDYSSVQLKDIELDNTRKVIMIQSIVDLLNENEELLDNVFEYYTSIQPNHRMDENISNVIFGIQNAVYQAGIRFSNYYRKDETDIVIVNLDEEIARNLFEIQLAQKEIDVELEWIPNDQHIEVPDDKKIRVIRFSAKLNKNEVAVNILHYKMYLIKVIMPQIAFVLILIGLSAFALIFTFQSYVKQIRLNVLRSDFINNITHELKIPVATAKAALEALQSFGLQADPQITEEYLKMVANEMNRLDVLTSRVLEHSKMEKQETHLKFEPVVFNEFLQSIIENMNALFIEKKVTPELITPDKHLTINIDQIYFEGVIKNLIDNSIKYGGDNTYIKIELKQIGKMAQLIISDDGPGIPEEYINKVFDKFFRVPKGDLHNIKGFGLGLSFVALVIKQHKGAIKAENTKPQGCRFIINLPLLDE